MHDVFMVAKFVWPVFFTHDRNVCFFFLDYYGYVFSLLYQALQKVGACI